MDRRLARLAVGPTLMAAALLVAGSLLAPSAYAALSSYGPVSTTTTTAVPPTTTPTTVPTTPTTLPPGGTTIAESTTAAIPGGAFTVSGTGFHANENVIIDIASPVVQIGSTTSSSSGTFSTMVTIPVGYPTGEHVITATDASGHSDSEDIDVVSSTTPGSTGPTGTLTGTSPPGSLAYTGTDIALTVGAGAGAIALGGLLVLGVRRRRSAWSG